MSLLKKASIITTPTAYAEDYLYSIKPAYALGSELVTNGDFSNGTNNWTPNANATLSVENGRLKVAISGAGSGYPSQDITTEVGKKYRITANAFIGTSTKVSLYSVVFGFNDLLVDGSYDLTFKATSTTTQIRLYVYGDGTYGFWDNVSIKEITDADFDFDRNSTGTRVNEDYLIEDVPYNLLSYTEELTNAYWDGVNVTVTGGFQDPFYGNNAFKVVDTSGGGTAYLHEPNISEENYGRSIYARTVSGTGTVSLLSYFGNTNNDFTLTEKWQRFYVNSSTTSTGAANFYAVDFRDGDLTEVLLYAPQLTKSSTLKDYLKTTDRLDIPRIDYTNGEPSILLEPSRTNSYEYSNDVTQSFWLNMGILIDTSNLYLSPEGINNSQKITANSGTYRLLRPQTNISGTGYTQSIFVKNINAINFYLRTASGFSYYNFETKTISLAGSDNLTAIHYPNDWVRLITTTPQASYKQFGFGQSETDSNDIGNSVYIYGAQLEAGSYATSLIHTSGSAVTRSADVANNAGNSDLINSTEGVLYAEMKALANDSTNRNITLSDGTTTNRIVLKYDNSSNVIQCFNRVAGIETASLTNTVVDITEFKKIAVKYKVNDYALYIDGKEVDTDTTSTTFVASTLNDLSLTPDLHAQVKSVMVFKEALTDLELEKLTGYNNHELYMNYYNRLSYLGLVEEYNVESDINNYIL